jgi:phage tail tube protein FII
VAIYNKMVADTTSALMVNVTDGTNNYIISLPKIEYTTGKVVAGGNNQDVMVDMGFQAVRNATYDHTIEISKF